MDKEKGRLDKSDGRRCPSISELFAYTSVVVVFVAIIIPLQFNYGFGPILKQVDFMVDEASILHPFVSRINRLKNLLHGSKEKIFTKEELKKFGPYSDDLIYLALLGKVYDVTSGKKHYDKSGAYSFFAGVDGTKAYATGKFDDEELIDDISDLDPLSYLSVVKWEEMFKNKYPCIGKVNGYFYDEQGKEREGMKILLRGIELGKVAKEQESKEDVTYPGCNSMFTPEAGSQVWCTQNSGAVNRDWAGVPRKFFQPGSTNSRCACVKLESLPDPRFREFEDCPPDSSMCSLKK